ncbi:MAG: hypothetical protein P8124_05335 [Gammaproteobacteria bacterium]
MTRENLQHLQDRAAPAGSSLEDAIIESDLSKNEVLSGLKERFGCPVVEYDEDLTASQAIVRRLDVETLKAELWMPLSVGEGSAEVIACRPDDAALLRKIREALGVTEIRFLVATAADLTRIIVNSWDLNADFPPSGGRTPLAKVRTYLAGVRTRYAAQRTRFARGRTGLALARTGLAFISIAVAFLRLFGAGWLLAMEIPLLILGLVAVVDGLLWYVPARRESKEIFPYPPYDVPEDYSALEVSDPGGEMKFGRSPVVQTAGPLRENWDALSPVERRRFLANDRTNLAEERTILAYLRTMMAKARTGLAFTRTGVAFAGIGIGFIRKFHPGPWTVFDWALIVSGVLMLAEGFYWYVPGRKAANAGLETVKKAGGTTPIWERIFPSLCHFLAMKEHPALQIPATQASAQPGVWATTGLALERTVLADRRNVMSRLRTVMARSRTGMAFIRTGFSILTVGAGLLIYFGGGDVYWTGFEVLLIAIGIYLIGDGLHWFIPAERIKRQLPYCFGDFEIQYPDYSEPRTSWKGTVFSDGK